MAYITIWFLFTVCFALCLSISLPIALVPLHFIFHFNFFCRLLFQFVKSNQYGWKMKHERMKVAGIEIECYQETACRQSTNELYTHLRSFSLFCFLLISFFLSFLCFVLLLQNERCIFLVSFFLRILHVNRRMENGFG